MAEQWIADPRVTGSNPVVPLLLVGVVGNISACHADARGSIPRLGVFFIFLMKKILRTKTSATGFEPARAEPTRFQVWLLNHSDTLTRCYFRL